MAQIVPGMAAEDDTVRAEQSGLTDFLVGGPARRTIGLDVLRLARPQDRQGDGDRDGDESAGRRDKGALDEYRWRIRVVGIPPPKERRRVIDRDALRQFEPGLSELWLKTEPPGRPLRCGPGRRQHNGQDESDLSPENTVSRHSNSDQLVMGADQRMSPLAKGNPNLSRSRGRIPWRGNRRGFRNSADQDRERRARSTDCSSRRR